MTRQLLRATQTAVTAVLLHASLLAHTASQPENPAVAEWKSQASKIQKILEEQDENCYGAPTPEIIDAFRVSGEPLSVALVDYCSSGAYTDWIVVMRMDHGAPVQAKFRDANGKMIDEGFANGASAMHSVGVKLVAEKRAIYDISASSDSEGRPGATCRVKAYVWNRRSRTFDLDTRLSKTASADYCRSLREKQKQTR